MVRVQGGEPEIPGPLSRGKGPFCCYRCNAGRIPLDRGHAVLAFRRSAAWSSWRHEPRTYASGSCRVHSHFAAGGWLVDVKLKLCTAERCGRSPGAAIHSQLLQPRSCVELLDASQWHQVLTWLRLPEYEPQGASVYRWSIHLLSSAQRQWQRRQPRLRTPQAEDRLSRVEARLHR